MSKWRRGRAVLGLVGRNEDALTSFVKLNRPVGNMEKAERAHLPCKFSAELHDMPNTPTRRIGHRTCRAATKLPRFCQRASLYHSTNR